jgi:hypothetical protein
MARTKSLEWVVDSISQILSAHFLCECNFGLPVTPVRRARALCFAALLCVASERIGETSFVCLVRLLFTVVGASIDVMTSWPVIALGEM